MASEQGFAFSTNDLRSRSIDQNRYNEQKHKWALGQAWGPGRTAEAHGKPVKPESRLVIQQARKQSNQHHPKPVRKHDRISDAQYISGDSSADEEVEHASAAPEPDAEVTYSYDSYRGPGQGSTILSQALTKAVERFENVQTDKLVKEEYEVLGRDGEPITSERPRKLARGIDADEDDYEFV